MNVKHHFLVRGNYLLSLCPVKSPYWDKSEKAAGRSGSFLLCTSATFHISLLLLPPLTSISLLLDLKRQQPCGKRSWSLLSLAYYHQSWSLRLSWQSDPSNGKSCCLRGLLQVSWAAEQVTRPVESRQWILPLQKSSRPGWADICLDCPQVTAQEKRRRQQPPQDLFYIWNVTVSRKTCTAQLCSSWWQHLHH